jgi:hypothetical protein
MLEKSVHGGTSCVVKYQEHYAMNAAPDQPSSAGSKGISRAEPLASWHELPDDIKKYDREAVLAFAEILAKAGLEVRRR